MPKIKYNLLVFMFILVFGCIGAFNLATSILTEDLLTEKWASSIFNLPPDAAISGTTTVCLNDAPLPEVTFTGSGGDAPYTFVYTINGGANQTVTTAGNDDSVSVTVNTNVAGDYVYELVTVTDSNNDTETVAGTATVTVAAPPTVSFTFNDGGCSADPVAFTSNVSGNGPFTYNWTFGDGSTSSDENPNHIYDAFGCGFSNFTAELTVTDDNGCSATFSSVVNVEQRPSLSFEDLDAIFTEPFDNCGNNTVDPSYTINVGNTSTSTACITGYDIDWGDGTSETNVTFPISHTYAELGSFNMVITGYGDTGCNATETILVKNSSNPVGAIISPGNTVNLCLPINELDFAIGSWGTNPPDTTYFINYGDGTTAQYTQAQLIAATANYDPNNPAIADPFPIPHEYTESNCPLPFYTITLVIATSCGQTVLTAGPIIILDQPTVDFEFETPGCVNTEIQFTNTTTGGFGPNCTTIANHSWDFGDGTTSNLENPTHTYTNPGTYTVTLIEENFCGVADPVQYEICIESELVADFSLDSNNGCIPFDVNATNTTDLTDSCGGETYLWEVNYTPDFCGTFASWNYTNGTNENSENPSFQFNSAGIYELTMTVNNSCGDYTTSQLVEVKQPPASSLNAIPDFCGTASINPVATVQTCAPASETIIYSWSFPGGTPATSNQLDPGTITYVAVGDYTITFEVNTSCGISTVTETFSINEIPSITNTDLAQTICSSTQSSEINLTSDLPGTIYTWTSNNPAGLTGYIPSGNTDTIPAQNLVNTTGADITLIYTVTPELNGCSGAPVNFEITVEPAPLILDQPISDEVCLNGTTSDLTVTFQGTGTPVYQWYSNTVDDNNTGTAIAGETGATFLPPTDTVGTTFYYVIITFSTGGCNEIISNTASITVADVAQVTSQPTPTQSVCIGGTADELSIAISGGIGSESYQWYINTVNSNTGGTAIAGATSPNYTPPLYTATGTYYYYLEISYTANGCTGVVSDVAEVVVVDDPVITSQPLIDQIVCENTATQDLEVLVSGGLGNISYQWYVNTVNANLGGTLIPGATNPTYTPPSNIVGTLYYYCVVTQDVSGCEVTSETGEVMVNPGAQFTAQPISDELCLGETTASLVVNFTNGTGTPTYQWYENTIDDTTTGTPIAGATTNTYDPPVNTVGTTYYYAILTFNSGGCSEIISQTAEIIVNETPSILDGSVLICSGNTFEYIPDTTGGAIVPGNTVYTWPEPVVVPAGAITGAVSQPTPSTTISQFLENNTTNPATVTYTVTPASGDCVGAAFEVVVTVNPSISVTSSVTNNNCFESNNASIEIDIAGGVPFATGVPYVITWNGPNGFTSSDEDIFNLQAGTYTLDIQDNGGCPYTETFTITEPDELAFSLVDFDPETISCFGANDGEINIDIEGGTMPYDYTWTLDGAPFSTDEDLSNLGPGIYAVSVTDANNCGPIELTFVIVEPTELQASLNTVSSIICFGEDTGAITVDIAGGRPGYTYSWIGPNGYTSSDQNINTLFAGTYTLTVTDTSDCADTLDVEVIQNDQLDIDVTTTEIECFGDNDASITINDITGGVPPYTVEWSNFGTGNSQTNLSAGVYIITITDSEDCVRDFEIEIEEAPIFLIDPVVTQMSCSGENDARIVLNFQGGIDPVTVVWDDDPSAGVERNNLAPGTYSVTITDGTPCVIQETFTIFDILPLQLSAGVTDALDCDDTNSGAINLLIEGGTPPFTISWSNGASSEDLDAIPPGTYVVSVIDANGCDIEGSWEVNRFAPLVLDVQTQTEVDCETRSIAQSFMAVASGGVPPFQYTWSSGTVSGVNNEMMTTDENGLVMLEVTDSQGCMTNFSLSIEIPVLGEPDFDVSSFGFLNFGVYAIQDPIEFTNTATGDFESILWDFGDGSFSSEENPIHTYLEVGSYIVTQRVTYPFGCVYERIITLVVEEGYKLVMPDAFTPNEDGLNDYFGPVFRGLNTLELNIFDTWGSLIYSESGENLRGWDGKIKDEVAENGNYYYTFTAKTFYGDEVKKQGAFVFIR
ncbi:PKD domain-containing protein [Winogradskyella alexanderae]|uniref:PKD domain-containing protein n=1 Tax=Winogradskyella alexanderae TaxID=2877123 RepID=A0ABS7XPH8_9FLAO|nr:PKD domain-containing protein [Winogradskyella alexanderae]MCA0131915.1 PKD domain-containing protein [Winogradskyella alexanderae]